MRKTALTIAGAVGAGLLAGSFIQAATASEHHHVRKAHRAPIAASQSFRNSNAYVRPLPAAVWPTAVWPAPTVRSDWSSHQYMDEALSPPAGH
jgi:hypothetical protein